MTEKAEESMEAGVRRRVPRSLLKGGVGLFLAVYLFLFLVTVAIYAPALGSGLLSDDWGNSYPVSFASVAKSFHGHWHGGGHGDFYRPLTRIAIWGQARLFGYDGFAQHLISLLVFSATAFVVSWKVFRHFGIVAGSVSAGVILLNPLNVEAVAWVSSQTDVLSAIWIVLALLVVARPPGELRTPHVVLSLVFSVLGYLSKDSSAALGPLFFVYALVMLLATPMRELLRNRPFLVVVGGQFVLFLVYLWIRRLFLGEVFPASDDTFEPDHGWMWHHTVALHNVLRHYSDILFAWFASHDGFVEEGGSLLWILLLLLGFCAWLGWKRQHAALGCLLGFGACLIPIIKTTHPWFYVEMVGAMRYYYLPNFFLGAFAGIVVGGPFREGPPPRSTATLLLIIALVVALQFSSEASHRALHWKVAGEIRENYREQIDLVADRHESAAIIAVHHADSFNGAYIFRNGFEEFVQLTYGPGYTGYSPNNFRLPQLREGVPYFRLVYLSDQRAPRITPYEEIEHAIANQRRRDAAAEPVAPVLFDFANLRVPDVPINTNDDLRVLDTSENPLLMRIVGSNPNMALQWSPELPARYRRASVRFEWVGLGEGIHGTDRFTFMWKRPGDRVEALPYIRGEVVVTPGVQEVVFDLGERIEWLSAEGFEWVRFDFGSRVRGGIRLHSIEFH